jgi:hypothetical protein
MSSKKSPTKPEVQQPPAGAPQGPDWQTRAMAIGSGVVLVAMPLLELSFWPALFAGEAVTATMSAADKKGTAERAEQLKWHMSLVQQEAPALVDALLAKPAKKYTDSDRIQLALLADWGLIDEKRAKTISPGHKAEILFTQLLLGFQQQGVGMFKMAEQFALPHISPDSFATPEGLKALAEDREKLRAWKTEASNPLIAKWTQKGLSAVSNLLPGKLARAVPVTFQFPSLKNLWKIAVAKGSVATAQEFMKRTAGELQGSFDAGFNAYRCAVRRSLTQAGVPVESALVAKPEGGRRFIVRPKEGAQRP